MSQISLTPDPVGYSVAGERELTRDAWGSRLANPVMVCNTLRVQNVGPSALANPKRPLLFTRHNKAGDEDKGKTRAQW